MNFLPWTLSVPQSSQFFLDLHALLENCSLLGEDNVRGQVSQHISTPKGTDVLFRYTNKSNLASVYTTVYHKANEEA